MAVGRVLEGGSPAERAAAERVAQGLPVVPEVVPAEVLARLRAACEVKAPKPAKAVG